MRTKILDQNPAIAHEPTMGIVLGGGFVYVANSQWGKYGNDGDCCPMRG